MSGVGTLIIGRPRPLSRHRRARLDYTLNCEEPVPMMPGMPEKRTHDYVRHGTTSLFAAFNTLDGTVISSIHRRHRAIEFKKFLAKIDSEVPAELDVHLVCDNYGDPQEPHDRQVARRTSCTSPRRTHRGSTKSSGSSPTSPPTCSNVQIIAASKHSKPTFANGSKRGTKTQSRSSGPRPRNRSSTHSNDFYNELPAQDTRFTRKITHAGMMKTAQDKHVVVGADFAGFPLKEAEVVRSGDERAFTRHVYRHPTGRPSPLESRTRGLDTDVESCKCYLDSSANGVGSLNEE